MRPKANLLAATLILFWCANMSPAEAADPDGKFAIGGAGSVQCADFVESQNINPEFRRVVASWMSGFFTALNAASADTFDIVPWHSPELIISIVIGHCQDYPNDSLASASWSIAKALEPQRLREQSEKIGMQSEAGKVRVYKIVLERVQERLTEQGFYNGAIDGEPGSLTIEAIRGYQGANDLEQTGLPDQFTLWKLFQVESDQ